MKKTNDVANELGCYTRRNEENTLYDCYRKVFEIKLQWTCEWKSDEDEVKGIKRK